ncbi:P-loop containing nucleoside triphosphate hydrolase protein [Daldinia decipiens]|uniref:P-loop containing nucleoside triphosphate hydrolase protein n=1 Tax=Daldinia decipiens TaxID=326647 RepID=UPI0020C27BC1|nr:P-loop containing nucleoside triphosphate hydrolase protein [Daldinia decipiens]KAI1659759.1 P-loop containing nucleoside triphosphate hydrolase protein [Daldinia decipiens]
MNLQSLGRQTWALTRKNLLITILRKWRSTLFRSLLFPIVVLVLLLEVQNFSKDTNGYGIANPRSVSSLADSMASNSKSLVLVQEPGLGADFQPVLEKITDPLDSNRLIHLEDSNKIDATCPVDYHGNSPCHAVVIFKDSPLSGHVNATWNYTIRTDPSLNYWSFNVFDTNSAVDKVYLPLQLAIENAMLNLTESPDFMPYTYQTQEEEDEQSRRGFLITALYLLSFIYYITFIPVGHHVAGMIASERESGMSDLIDAMGGGVAWPRVLSYVFTFDILYLPLWIIMGALYWALLVPSQNAAVTIFWQIFTGWAITSSSVFGAAFFKRSAFASLWVSLIPWLLAICCAFSENLAEPAPLSQVVTLSFFFPSMNYIYFFNFIAKAEIAGIRLNMQQPIPDSSLDMGSITGQGYGVNWVSLVGPYFLWVILVVQIIGYALLAVLVETFLHGNNHHRRTFHDSPEAVNSHVAIETIDLEKQYRPSWFKKLFCCARTPKTKAVDGLNLVSQKRQILCLLGPNGSGKTSTLDMLAGFQVPTGGQVHINASPSQLGICPQRNVLWDNLTVYEHLVIWNALKGNTEDPTALEKLIEKCDLALKKSSFSRNLSGGMKRKLQLACMLVGGSSVCLMDEVTSGLDPLSRRVIWNVVLSERSQRTMVLTTHFLDECEVLSDHIVIITLGKLKCQGTPTELKNQYGGGYRVHIPRTEDVSSIPYPVTQQHDRYICRTPDSASAAGLIASLKNSSDSELYITGPTIEDVFLKVSEEPHTLIGETPEDISIADSQPSRVKSPYVEPPLWVTYSQQFWALFLKRIQVLRSNWWAYLFALAIPIIATYAIGTFLKNYEVPDCSRLISFSPYDSRMSYTYTSAFVLGPPSVNNTVEDIISATSNYHYSSYGGGPYLVDSRNDLEDFVRTNTVDISYGGAAWIGNDTKPLVAYSAMSGSSGASGLLNLVNQVRSGGRVAGYLSTLRSYHQAEGGESMFYVTIFCLLQALYPAFFSLYPTYERRSQVRELQYSNGVRPFPLLFSYWMFDFVFVLVITAVCTALIAPIAPWFGIGYIWFIQVLYGLAAILFAYLISLMSRSQPAAFAYSILFMTIMYVISIVALLVIQITDSANQMANDGTAYGLGLIFPIQNLMRGMAVSLNMYIVRCRGQDMVTDPGSFYAFGGPIMLLILQIVGLFNLLLWLEGGSFAWISKPKHLPPIIDDAEKSGFSSGRPDVDAETARVAASEMDLLRALHVSKKFGPNVAVDDVSLGLQEGEILALLGPNGAGKTTMINMIRGDLTPSSGRIYLEGVDVLRNKRLAQKHLGVCPQFDALDLLTVREHLTFYARCKGVDDIKSAVSYVMARVGITAHASKMAAKLSGGNKRKLSLAIALLGDPPVLLLDEPSSAMDAASKRVLWRTLAAVAPGRSVLLTTHSMEEADALATRAAIVARRVLAVGTTEALRKTHSNEYHVHLILRSAPLSTAQEMRGVEEWVRRTFGNALRFEGESLGGQVRFVVPADSNVPESASESSAGDDIAPAEGRHATRSFTRYLIETLEARKEELGIDCYSISAATMESVFMKVVKESDVAEDEGRQQKRWWRW